MARPQAMQRAGPLESIIKRDRLVIACQPFDHRRPRLGLHREPSPQHGGRWQHGYVDGHGQYHGLDSRRLLGPVRHVVRDDVRHDDSLGGANDYGIRYGQSPSTGELRPLRSHLRLPVGLPDIVGCLFSSGSGRPVGPPPSGPALFHDGVQHQRHTGGLDFTGRGHIPVDATEVHLPQELSLATGIPDERLAGRLRRGLGDGTSSTGHSALPAAGC